MSLLAQGSENASSIASEPIRPITRSLESAGEIAALEPAAADVHQWLRAYTTHASVRFYCRVERRIPAHRHASDNAFFPSRQQTCKPCPSASWPHSAGSTASDRYYVGDRSFFRPRRDGTGIRSGSLMMAIGVCRASVRAGDEWAACSGAASRAAWVTLPTIACPPSLTDTCCTVTVCWPPVR